MDAPIYEALVIEREGHPTDDEIAAALASWQPGDSDEEQQP